MNIHPDDRIPVVFGGPADAADDDAVLIEDIGGMACPAAGTERFTAAGRSLHLPGCACCAPRDQAAEALGRLFLARARGAAPMFRRVVAATTTEAGADAVRRALREDRVASARFRLG
jgi:hypothetical protein